MLPPDKQPDMLRIFRSHRLELIKMDTELLLYWSTGHVARATAGNYFWKKGNSRSTSGKHFSKKGTSGIRFWRKWQHFFSPPLCHSPFCYNNCNKKCLLSHQKDGYFASYYYYIYIIDSKRFFFLQMTQFLIYRDNWKALSYWTFRFKFGRLAIPHHSLLWHLNLVLFITGINQLLCLHMNSMKLVVP